MQSFLFPFCLVAATVMMAMSWMAIQTSRRIVGSWIRVEDARIVECKIKSRAFCSWPVIVYEYDAGDLRHIGRDTPPLPTLVFRTAQFRRRYPSGRPLVVYVNPENHQISTIAPQRLYGLGMFGLAAAALCLMYAGIAGFAGN